MQVLVAGATGFVGSRLVPVLLGAGHDVRALTRHPQDYRGPARPVGGDVRDAVALEAAMHGCDAAYYLVHSLDAADFAERDAQGARAFGAAAASAGIGQIVYLGGLGVDGDALSAHLRSRRDVEQMLGESGVPETVLRAGIVVGNGGLSWELTRQLVSHLPLMVTPRWVSTRSQPIAIDDVVCYLAEVLGVPAALGAVYEVGGPEVLTYAEMLRRVAHVLHRPLVVLPVPLLTPRLSSAWLSLVTSVDKQTATALVDSMTNEVIVSDTSIQQLIPRQLMSFETAARQALDERRASSREQASQQASEQGRRAPA